MMKTNTLTAIRNARLTWNDGKFAEAAQMYREAAEGLKGWAKDNALRCAADCDAEKPFTGQIKGVHYY